MRLTIILLFAVMAFGASVQALAGERKAADITCQPTDQKLVFDCTIILTGNKTGAPIDGAVFMVGAHMPSMPGMHNMIPVLARSHEMPGMYSAHIQLEMFGEWALNLDFSKPSRDRVVQKLYFTRIGSHTGLKKDSTMAHETKQGSE